MKNAIAAIAVLCLFAGCIGGGVYAPPDIEFHNVTKLIINSAPENGNVKIVMYYDTRGGDFKKGKYNYYSEAAEELFSGGIDISFISIDSDLDPPPYLLTTDFKNSTLTVTVKKSGE